MINITLVAVNENGEAEKWQKKCVGCFSIQLKSKRDSKSRVQLECFGFSLTCGGKAERKFCENVHELEVETIYCFTIIFDLQVVSYIKLM